MEEDKLLRRESGQFKAVCEEVLELLDATREVVNKIKTDPPPPIAKRLAGVGYYQITGRAAPIEQIKTTAYQPRPKKDDPKK